MATEKSIVAKEKKRSETTAVKKAAQAGNQTRIMWDDSTMRSVYANVSNVAGTQEEIILLFGMNQAWRSGQKEVKVQLTDRVVSSPFAAKRFAILLNNVLKDYEKQYGTLEIGVPQAQAPPASTQ